MTFDWHTEYARALQAFGGDTPSATLEQDLLDAFSEHPQAVTNAITKIAKAYAAGKIHSPWGALKTEIPKQISRDTRVGDSAERNRMITAAEHWITNTGKMFDRWNEVHDELYERGFAKDCTLKPWARDKQLAGRMETHWLEQRPTGERIETEEIERAERWKETQAALAAKPTEPLDDTALRALATAKSAA